MSPTPGYSCDAYTGWLNSHFVLEAEEIPKEYSMVPSSVSVLCYPMSLALLPWNSAAQRHVRNFSA